MITNKKIFKFLCILEDIKSNSIDCCKIFDMTKLFRMLYVINIENLNKIQKTRKIAQIKINVHFIKICWLIHKKLSQQKYLNPNNDKNLLLFIKTKNT